MHIKRAWNHLVFIGTFEVFDYLILPITTYKSTPKRESHCLGLEGFLELSKFQKYQISAIRFFLFYDVHTKLYYALYFIGNYIRYYSVRNRLQRYALFPIRQKIFFHVRKNK